MNLSIDSGLFEYYIFHVVQVDQQALFLKFSLCNLNSLLHAHVVVQYNYACTMYNVYSTFNNNFQYP